MLRRILIANRGEIAVRIIRACRELNIETIAVYSEADRDSLHVQMADIAVCVGPASSQESYLNLQNIMAAAVAHGAEGIHPGYGYLSEQALFAEMCEAHNIVFIGPTAEQIELLGDKTKAKATMKAAGVPVIPGSDGEVTNEKSLVELADKLGYPVIVKASAGGGGKGMRLARNKEELLHGFSTARAEAAAAFNNDAVYLEKFIEGPRHIEVQLLGDNFGNVVHFGERECSLQRRHQKLIEECPSPAVSEDLRANMGEKAVLGAKAVNYRNAGTMEFLLDKHNNFYFMEMNTRIQVEHPVTEMVYGIDLVKEQIRLASGELLGYGQEDLVPSGHAIECRINAEEVRVGSRPSPGKIETLFVPGGNGVRWDSHAHTGYVISPFYDSMFAKIIAWAPDREEAIQRMQRSLQELVVEGIETSIPFHREMMGDERFRNADFTTDFVEQWLEERKLSDKK
ncbi:MAG: acetyl-CoA carboxylase biotin carboxylase subunit [Bacillota bacterium]|nr:acetyl-CoA carboxylase biotin carboxylase subunit [Bacillota bacterium]HHU60415.1 acetyl-CoA carboxylase biotin carboxylase subunit [Natronincola sp.]